MKIYKDTDIYESLKGKRVLDIGCLATAEHNILRSHLKYKENAKEIIGVDYNKKFLEITKKKFPQVKNLHYLDITDNDGVSLFIKKFGTFECVVCTDVIEHVGNLTLFLDNIYRLISDNGVLHITTPNALCPNWIVWANASKNGMTKVNPDHICMFEIKTLTSLLKRSKLKVVECRYHDVKGNKRIIELGLKPKSWMGKRIYVIVKKEI